MQKIILFLFTAFLLFSACTSSSTSEKKEEMKAETKLDITPDMLAVKVDPICGMNMEQSPIGDTMTYKGNLYGFCHSGCKEEFKADPEKALAEFAKK
jgi:YHS domain-containing protein